MSKLAIIGLHPDGVARAPTQGWERWSLPWRSTPPADRYFDIHHPDRWLHYGGPDYARKLARLRVPVVLRDVHPDVPNGEVYPLRTVEKLVGQHLSSSIAFMLGYAVLRHRTHPLTTVGIWGVELAHGTEYASQRPDVLYLIGWLRGAGVTVTTPGNCRLHPGVTAYGGPLGET